MMIFFFQNLIDLICDVKSMEDAVIEMKYDAKKAPLGKNINIYYIDRCE